MSQAADVHEGPEVHLVRQPSCTGSRGVSRRLAPLPWSMASLLHTLLHGRANVSAANKHEQAGFRGQVADASRDARFGERPTIASLPTVTALRSHGTRYPPYVLPMAGSEWRLPPHRSGRSV